MQIKEEKLSFSIKEYKKQQEYLRQQHRQGWKLLKITGGFLKDTYIFEQCQPADMVYHMGCHPEGKDVCMKLFAERGWEYILNHSNFCLFRKPAAEITSEDKAICDDNLRLAVMRNNLRSHCSIYLALALTQSVFLFRYFSEGNYKLAGLIGFCIAIFLFTVIKSIADYWRFKATLKN